MTGEHVNAGSITALLILAPSRDRVAFLTIKLSVSTAVKVGAPANEL